MESADADGEGTSNLTEIQGGSLPGWCDPTRPGCLNQGFTRTGDVAPAVPPADVMLDPPILQPPGADPGGPYEGLVGLRIAFDGSASADADGSVVAWDWKFGDGGSATGARAVFAFDAAGTYTITLRVTDNDGLRTLASTEVLVRDAFVPAAPTARAGGPYAAFAGDMLTFDGSTSSDADGVIAGWQWDFGDGGTANDPMPTHVYNAPGNYTVTLTVTDNDGLTDTDQTVANVEEPLGPGEQIFRTVCEACHGDPWNGAPVDPSLVAGRRNAGARVCSIQGAINGTAVFPGGVPQMQFLQGAYSTAQIAELSSFLNSQPLTGQQRFVTTCAGCHGTDAAGGRVGEDVRGRDADRIRRALNEVPAMAFLSCLPNSDIELIGGYLETLDDD